MPLLIFSHLTLWPICCCIFPPGALYFLLFPTVTTLPTTATIIQRKKKELMTTSPFSNGHRKSYCSNPWFKILHITIWHSRNGELEGIKSWISWEDKHATLKPGRKTTKHEKWNTFYFLLGATNILCRSKPDFCTIYNGETVKIYSQPH